MSHVTRSLHTSLLNLPLTYLLPLRLWGDLCLISAWHRAPLLKPAATPDPGLSGCVVAPAKDRATQHASRAGGRNMCFGGETWGWPPPQNQAKSALLTPGRRVGPLEYIQSHPRLSKSATPSKTQSPLRAVTPGVTTVERRASKLTHTTARSQRGTGRTRRRSIAPRACNIHLIRHGMRGSNGGTLQSIILILGTYRLAHQLTQLEPSRFSFASSPCELQP